MIFLFFFNIISLFHLVCSKTHFDSLLHDFFVLRFYVCCHLCLLSDVTEKKFGASNKLWLGNLNNSTTEQDIKDLCKVTISHLNLAWGLIKDVISYLLHRIIDIFPRINFMIFNYSCKIISNTMLYLHVF